MPMAASMMVSEQVQGCWTSCRAANSHVTAKKCGGGGAGCCLQLGAMDDGPDSFTLDYHTAAFPTAAPTRDQTALSSSSIKDLHCLSLIRERFLVVFVVRL